MNKPISIAITSGKGGTGKTFVSTNLAIIFSQAGFSVRYLDCDVEEPNAHLFLNLESEHKEDVTVQAPSGVDETLCTMCGKCVEVCRFHAIAKIKDSLLFFPNLCHVCGGCDLVCPHNAIQYASRKIGEVINGKYENISLYYGLLETGEGAMTPRLIRNVKEHIGTDITLLDSPPGTSCPVVETVKDADLCVMITDPTPFGIHDLKLAADMCRQLGKEPVVIVNRAGVNDSAVKEFCGLENLEIIGEIPDERKIAESYSEGKLAVKEYPEIQHIFQDIGIKIQNRVKQNITPKTEKRESIRFLPDADNMVFHDGMGSNASKAINQIVVISGKGGTGKTSIAAAFCALEKNITIADCDVDASDLHLLLKPEVQSQGIFSGGMKAKIDETKCSQCGECYKVCRFDAVNKIDTDGIPVFRIDPAACEGCGVCTLVCRENAIQLFPAANGEWFESNTRFGPMSHARLFPGEENSGKLVSLLKTNAQKSAQQNNSDTVCIDGSPGTGCPVIASLNNTRFAVIVTEPTVSGLHDLKRIGAVVKFFRIPAGVIVNKADINNKKTSEIRNYTTENGFDFLGEIQYDKAVTEAQIQGVTIIEYADTAVSVAIQNIWNKVQTITSQQ